MNDVRTGPAADGPAIEVVPLGGLGEFGMNMMALTWGETTIVVDAGVMFPGPGAARRRSDHSRSHLPAAERRRGGARADARPRGSHRRRAARAAAASTGRSTATPLTLALRRAEARSSTASTDAIALVPVRPRDRVTVGPFEIEFIRVTHSMPDCVALAIHTPLGVIVHTGDFKIDQTPLDGQHFDVHRFAAARRSDGVLALFADSTNIDRRGFTGSELDVVDAFEEIFTSATGRLIVAAFASSIYRMQILVDLARAVRPQGGVRRPRHDARTREIAQRLGYLRHSRRGCRSATRDVPKLPAAGRALPDDRLAGRADVGAVADRDRRPPPREARSRTTRWCFSARAIPGNEKAIGRVINHLARRGADVDLRGHQARARLRPRQRGGAEADAVAGAAALLRAGPRRIPAAVAARARRRARVRRHASRSRRSCSPRTATSCTSTTTARRIAGKAPVGRVLIDGTRTGEVGDEVLRDRRHLAEDGLVVPVVAINKQTGALEGVPDIITRGFVMEDSEDAARRRRARCSPRSIEQASVEERTDQGLIKEKLRVELRRFFRKRSGRRPFVLPVIMEI